MVLVHKLSDGGQQQKSRCSQLGKRKQFSEQTLLYKCVCSSIMEFYFTILSSSCYEKRLSIQNSRNTTSSLRIQHHSFFIQEVSRGASMVVWQVLAYIPSITSNNHGISDFSQRNPKSPSHPHLLLQRFSQDLKLSHNSCNLLGVFLILRNNFI